MNLLFVVTEDLDITTLVTRYVFLFFLQMRWCSIVVNSAVQYLSCVANVWIMDVSALCASLLLPTSILETSVRQNIWYWYWRHCSFGSSLVVDCHTADITLAISRRLGHENIEIRQCAFQWVVATSKCHIAGSVWLQKDDVMIDMSSLEPVPHLVEIPVPFFDWVSTSSSTFWFDTT